MFQFTANILIVAAAAVAPSAAAENPASSKGWPAAYAGKGEKVCRDKFPNGEKRVWVCKTEEPCCALDLIQYTKCGSTITNCL